MDGRRVLLGRVVGVYGVRGAVKLESFTEPRLAIFDYRPWRLERADGVVREIGSPAGRAQGRGIVAELPGIGDRNAAAGWMGAEISVDRASLPDPAAGELYQADLEGLPVRNLAGDDLGRVSYLFDNGAHRVLVTRDAAGRQRLIPWVLDRYVKAVDLGAGSVVVDWDKDD